MDIIQTLLMKIWSPELLIFPSPLLKTPANWLIPAILWLAILRYVISLIRSEQMMWLWTQIGRLITYGQTSLGQALVFPTPRPLGNLLAEFSGVIAYFLFAVYFSLYGFVILLMSIPRQGTPHPLISLAVMLMGFGIILAGRYYWVQTVKTKLKLLELWRQYPKNKGWAAFSILILTGVMLDIALWGAT